MTKEPGTGPERLLQDFPEPRPEQWRQEVERLLRGAPFAKRMFTSTVEGITVGPMYTPADIKDLPWAEHLPGQVPFVRGSRVSGFLQGKWLIAQELPLPSAKEFNVALRHDLDRGQNTVCLRLDKAGTLGRDPDQAEAGNVGREGTSISALSELETALEGVDLQQTPICIQPGSSALPMAAMLSALLAKRGISTINLQGNLGSDPVFGLASKGILPVGLDQIYDELAILTRWAREFAPGVTTLPINETPWHDGGADSALSLGLVLASAVQNLRALESRGLYPEDLAPFFRFRMVLGTDFFLEMAKLRALRLLWSDIMASCGCAPAAGAAKIHGMTSQRCLSRVDLHVNILRSTTMAMSGVLGGVDSLFIRPFDYPEGIPDEFSRRVARNIHLILAEECHFDQVADPAGGSWYVEKLTAELASKAWTIFQDIEARGGIVQAMHSGYVQDKVAASCRERRQRMATGRDVLVGTNRYVNPQEPDSATRFPDYKEFQKLRSREMAELRASEIHENHLLVLKKLEKILTAKPSEVFNCLVDAATHGATIGELTGILRHADEKKITVDTIPLRRDAEPFERLRFKVAASAKMNPATGKVFCACLGDFARYMPRLDFVRGFFQVGGFEVLSNEYFNDDEALANAATSSGAATMVLVGLDEAYQQRAVASARILKSISGAPRIFLAGNPGALEDEMKAAGVDEFVNLRSNVLEILGGLIGDSEVEA